MTLDPQVSYPEAALMFGKTPLEAMAWIQVLGLAGSGQTTVSLSIIKAAASKMGLALPVTPQLAATAIGVDSDPEEVHAAIDADPNPRRRFLRNLLHKMERHGNWHPNTARSTSLRHGFGDPEAGWVRPALAALIKAGWVLPATLVRRDRNDPPVGLVGDERGAILEFIHSGAPSSEVVADFIEERG